MLIKNNFLFESCSHAPMECMCEGIKTDASGVYWIELHTIRALTQQLFLAWFPFVRNNSEVRQANCLYVASLAACIYLSGVGLGTSSSSPLLL